MPDLPAHGARFKETPLTLGNAVSTLYQVIHEEVPGKRVRLAVHAVSTTAAAAGAAASWLQS